MTKVTGLRSGIIMKKGTIMLQGEKLKLRRYKTEDIPELHEKLGCDPDMMRYTGWNPYASMESATGFILGKIDGYETETDEYSWVIEAAGRVSGIIGAYDYDAEENSIEVGYSIFRDFWGKGYAQEALSLVCEYLMTEEGIEKIKAWSAVDNTASKKVLEKAGFIETEILEAAINVEGMKYDQVFYEKR